MQCYNWVALLRSSFHPQATRKGKKTIANGVAIAKGHCNLAALLANVKCASQIQVRLGEEIYLIMASPGNISLEDSKDSHCADPAGPQEKHARVAAIRHIINTFLNNLADACGSGSALGGQAASVDAQI